MKICNKMQAMVLMGAVAGMLAHTASAVLIDIDGRLSDSTEASALEWGDNSSTPDSGLSTPIGSNKPAPVSDDNGTLTLTVTANIQDWERSTNGGTYDAGEEWNIRSSSNATTAENAFLNGAYIDITLDSTGNSSDLFSWNEVSVSLWRNGSGADQNYQLAVDTNGDGFDVGDLVGTTTTPSAGIGGATTLSFSNVYGSGTANSVRLYHWGQSSIAGNFHVYDVAAEYTVVPEPATFGLIAVFGSGILFVRRRYGL